MSKTSSVLFTPSGCLTGDALMLFVSGTLEGAELAKAQQHISECPLCSDAADGLRMWLKENSLQNRSISGQSENQAEGTPVIPGKEQFEAITGSQSTGFLFHNRTALLNERIKQRIHARTPGESEEVKRLAYKPFVWLTAAASVLLFIGVGYVFWLQNQHNERLQAQKQLKDREAALIAQIPETLAYPPSSSTVILDVKYNSEKGAHVPPVVTIVNENAALASDKAGTSRKNAVKTDDEAEYTESRQGVESDVFREEYGMYKGQNSKRTLPAKHTGGAMTKAESGEELSSVFISVQQMPSFPGGDAARIKYLAKNLRYPSQAAEDGIQGTINVSFIVKSDGRITNVKILRGIGGGCDEEAIRVVSKMPQWKPGYLNGKKVDVRYNMPVYFRIQ